MTIHANAIREWVRELVYEQQHINRYDSLLVEAVDPGLVSWLRQRIRYHRSEQATYLFLIWDQLYRLLTTPPPIG